ncbi:RNase H domain-containing protein [Trichonephila clavipes]|nr:RNase H domain-containing protein [Trichonephila clavipes]
MSARTIRLRLQQIGLFTRRPLLRLPLTWKTQTFAPPIFDSDRIHFQTELLTRVCKGSDVPEFTRQIALDTSHGIPHSALKISTDGSMGDGGISGSGVHFETSDGTFDIKISNINYCSVFRSELIVIYKGLKFIDTASDLVFRDIWILTDSRASIQPLSHWTIIGDTTSLNILNSSRHSIYFPSHIGWNGKEIADSLAKSATADALRGDAYLTFAELSSIKRMHFAPAHPWYFGRKPPWCHQLNIPRDRQTALSRFFNGHIKSLTFEQGRKVFPECQRCEADKASPSHILNCLSLTFDEVLRNPILFLHFLEIFGFMEMV